jgi:hypothetical protein
MPDIWPKSQWSRLDSERKGGKKIECLKNKDNNTKRQKQ